jgi:16S rRNA processing protein RimM
MDGNGSEKRAILHIGRIGRAHGLNGEVKATVLSSDPDRLNQLTECLLLSADEKEERLVQIAGVRPAGSQVIIKLEGIDDRSQAERVNGCFLSVRRDQALALQSGQWFVCDLIGCRVYDDTEGDLGSLLDILPYRAQDIYVVRLAGQPDLLFPALKNILRQIDPVRRRIDVHLPEGLYEVYRRRES